MITGDTELKQWEYQALHGKTDLARKLAVSCLATRIGNLEKQVSALKELVLEREAEKAALILTLHEAGVGHAVASGEKPPP